MPPASAAATVLRACTGGSSSAGATDSNSTGGISRGWPGGIMSCSVRIALSGATTDELCSAESSIQLLRSQIESLTIAMLDNCLCCKKKRRDRQ